LSKEDLEQIEKIIEQKLKEREEITMSDVSNIPTGIKENLYKAQKALMDLKDFKKFADLDRNHRLSAYEILFGFISYPKFFASLVSLIISVYVIISGIVGFITKEFNWLAFAIAICIVIALLILYLVVNKLNKVSIETIKRINSINEEIMDKKNIVIEKQDDIIEKLKTERDAFRNTCGLLKFALDSYKVKHPTENIPNISLPNFDDVQ